MVELLDKVSICRMPTQDTLDRFYALTLVHEGSVPHMYLDTKGYVTVGVGFMLPSPEAAAKLGFEPRSVSAIAADWRAVKAAPAGKVAKWYRPLTHCVLPESALRKEFDLRVNDMLRILSGGYKLDQYPVQAQLGILDMMYNLGPVSLMRGWPSFKAACNSQDWLKAAANCSRKGVSTARNEETKALFLACVSQK